MSKIKETKEQLIIELTKIRQSHADWVSGDERRRKEFAKAFHWVKPQEMYSPRVNEPASPSWEQIFVEVGKLLASRNFLDFEGNVSELEHKLEELENKVSQNIEKKV